jgi:hypothetical protein
MLLKKLALASALALGVAPVFATTIDFNDYKPSYYATGFNGSYTDSASGFSLNAVHLRLNPGSGYANYDGTPFVSIVSIFGTPNVTLSDNGAAFSLQSLAINADSGNQITFTGTESNGSTVNFQSGLTGWSIVDFSGKSGWNNLTSVTISTTIAGDQLFLDNINVAAAVPEPEEWALMLAGLPLVGWNLRNRKAA